MKGSLTVEAAFVFPFCIIVILIICQLGIYQYNQEVLKVSGYECVIKTVEEENLTNEQLRISLQKRAMELASERLLNIEKLTAEVKITDRKILVTFQGIQGMLNAPVKVEIFYERVYPELTLRMTRTGGRI